MELEATFALVIVEEEAELGEELAIGRSSKPTTMSHSCFATNKWLIMYAHIG